MHEEGNPWAVGPTPPDIPSENTNGARIRGCAVCERLSRTSPTGARATSTFNLNMALRFANTTWCESFSYYYNYYHYF